MKNSPDNADEYSPFIADKTRIMHTDNQNSQSPSYILEYSWRVYNSYHVAHKTTF